LSVPVEGCAFEPAFYPHSKAPSSDMMNVLRAQQRANVVLKVHFLNKIDVVAGKTSDVGHFPNNSSQRVIKEFLKNETRKELIVICLEETIHGDPLHDPQNLGDLIKFSSELDYGRTLILAYKPLGVHVLYDSTEKPAIKATYFQVPSNKIVGAPVNSGRK
jgi:hypothetical protein